MDCQQGSTKPDWKAYVLGEMDASARRAAEGHAADCSSCQEEWLGLRVTLDAMATMREEEVPRRIAFVSDKVFEPRWWQAFLRPSGVWAAAALIAGAILAHGFVRPAANTPVDAAAIKAEVTKEVTQQVTAEVTARMQAQLASSIQTAVQSSVQTSMQLTMQTAVDSAVKKAVTETRAADDMRTAALLKSTDRRYLETAEFLNKQVTRIYAMNSGAGVR